MCRNLAHAATIIQWHVRSRPLASNRRRYPAGDCHLSYENARRPHLLRLLCRSEDRATLLDGKLRHRLPENEILVAGDARQLRLRIWNGKSIQRGDMRRILRIQNIACPAGQVVFVGGPAAMVRRLEQRGLQPIASKGVEELVRDVTYEQGLVLLIDARDDKLVPLLQKSRLLGPQSS